MIASASDGFSGVSFTLAVVVLIFVTVWVVCRLAGMLRFHDDPKGTKKSSPQSRWAEALMLLCMSLVIWAFTATNTSTGGRLFLLDQLHPAFAGINVILAVLSLLGVLCSSLIAARRSSSLGVLVCAAVLTVNACFLNGPDEWLESFVPEEARAPRTILNFELVNCHLPGAELYVNGVPLGVLPVTIDQTDLLDRVPVWDDEPAFLDRSDIPDGLIRYNSPNSSSRLVNSLYQKLRITTPDDREIEYYAQVKHHDRWCYTTGRGGGGGGGGRYVRRMRYRLSFLSPDHEQRLERLLDWARLRDSNVPRAWFEAIETYGLQGTMALLQKETDEPGMGAVLDQWALLRFKLDEVNDEDTAWQAFEALCHHVTKQQAYSTQGLEGRAVAWLAPKLSTNKLTARAKRLLRSTRYLSWSQWRSHGEPQFGIGRNQGRFVIAGRGMSYASGGRGAQLPIAGYAVAHALWVQSEQGSQHARDALQHRLMPLFIAQFHRGFPRHRFVCSVGGPVLERFLQRQDWQADAEQLPWNEQVRTFGHESNGWFYMLTCLESPVGKEFRHTHREQIFEMADAVHRSYRPENMDFLFVDLDQGKASLAYQYWPRFLEKIAGRSENDPDAVEDALDYLLRLGTVAESGMYVEVFNTLRQWDRYSWRPLETASSLPLAHRRRVCEALCQAIEGDISHLSLRSRNVEEVRADMIKTLRAASASDQEKAEQLYHELITKRSRYFTDEWLGQMEEDHAVVPLLAASNRADLRRMALYAIEAHPSLAHRALLEQLLQDGDSEVSRAAKAVKETFEDLANTSVEQLRAN